MDKGEDDEDEWLDGWPGAYHNFWNHPTMSGLFHEVQLVDGTCETLARAVSGLAHWFAIFFCGQRATSGHEEDQETRREERIHQKMEELRRRKREHGRNLMRLRSIPKSINDYLSMTGVSRADALEEIERKKWFPESRFSKA